MIFLLGKVLDFRVLKHNLITSNIAHQDTPGYRAKELPFQEVLRSVLVNRHGGTIQQTHPQHFTQASFNLDGIQVEAVSSPSLGLDQNSVNIEYEMAALAENALQYQAAAQILAKKFAGLKQAIRENP
jgi:flagellar basal-body rod protein FlgB